METVHVRTIVQPDGSVHINNIPFAPGEEVEVILRLVSRTSPSLSWTSLQGIVLRDLAPEESPLSLGEAFGSMPGLDTTIECEDYEE